MDAADLISKGWAERLTRCPGCASERLTVESQGSEICSCLDCTLLFTNPRPTQDFVAQNYSEGNYYARFVPDDNWVGMWNRRVARITRYLPRGRIFDISAGIGTQVHLLRKLGYDAQGSEISSEAIAKAASLYGINLVQGYVEDVCKVENGSLDAVTMWHVFEHLPNPGMALPKIRSMLKAGGWLFLAVPNNSMDRIRLLPKHWSTSRKERLEALIERVPYEKTFSEIHLIHFTPGSLANIVRRSGFEVVELSLDNISLRPSRAKDAKYAVRNFMARRFGFFGHKALFLAARKT